MDMFNRSTKLGLGSFATYDMMKYYMEEGEFHYFEVSNYYNNIDFTARFLQRYNRNQFFITAKLHNKFDINKMYEALGLEYIDCVMIHAAKNVKCCSQIPLIENLVRTGCCKYIGVSFHGESDGLKSILEQYPSINVVQLELTPVNYEDKKALYELCRQYNKRLIVMGAFRMGLKSGYSVPELVAHYKYLGADIILSTPESLCELKNTLSLLKTVEPKLAAVSNTDNRCIQCGYCMMCCPSNLKLCDFYNEYLNRSDKVALFLKYDLKKCVSCGKCVENCVSNINLKNAINEVKVEVKRRLKR